MAAAGSIWAGVARTEGAAEMRDNSAMATTNPRAYAFLGDVGDNRVPSRRSAGLTRGRTRIMSDLLNHLVGRLSDALQWVFGLEQATSSEGEGIRSRSRAGSGRAALEPREQAFGPGPPRRRIAAASLRVIESGELLVPRREGARVDEPVDHP